MNSQREDSTGGSHVVGEVADFLGGHLDRGRAGEIRRHLLECSDCAADYAWAQVLCDEALRQGLRHVSAERLVAVAERAAATEAEEAHLARCAACRGELEWARGLTVPPEAADEAARPAPEPHPAGARRVRAHGARLRLLTGWFTTRPWRGTALAAAAAAALLLVAVLPRGGDERIAAFARIEPLPVRIPRASVEPTPFEASRMAGLEHYASGDYAQAAERLSRAAEIQPGDSEILLYLGSSELLLGRPGDAARLLAAAARAASDPVLKEESLWQLANAHLATGRGDEAARVLEEVAAIGLTHRDEATRSLEQLAPLGVRPQ